MNSIGLERVQESDVRDLFAHWSDIETIKFTNWAVLGGQKEAFRLERVRRRYAELKIGWDPSSAPGPVTIRAEE